MRINIFKKLAVFLIVFLTIFSNTAFYVISGLINSIEITSGIVDKVWLLQNEQRSDVVDNFSSIRNVANKLRVMEAMAAITYNTNSAIVYSASGGTSISPAYPTGITAGSLLVLTIGMKPSSANGGSVTTPSGWTPITSLTGAGGYSTTLGTDTGNTNIFSFYKVALGTETGSLAVTLATNGVSWARMYLLSAAAGSTWSVVGATGSDVTSGTAVSIAHSSNPGVTAGDYIIGAMVIPTDVTTPSQFSAEALSQAGVTFSTVTEIGEADTTTGSDLGGVMYRASVTAGTATGNPTFTATAGGTTTNVRGPGIFIRIREIPAAVNTTTISNFVSAEPGNSTIAPGASALVDSFGLSTDGGTDTMTAAVVGLASGMWQYIQTVAITNDGDTVTYCSATPSADTVSLTSCTVPITTTNTQFKIKITADPHASMPSPPGGSYAVTAKINSFTSTNGQAGTDSGSSTVTIDNLSPNSATAVSGSAGNAANTLNWTTSNSADFNITGGSVIYRWASVSAGAEVPVEGVTSNTVGSTNGAATVACVVSSAASTALTRTNGTGGSADCTTAALTNGQAYTYKVFQKGNNGNYDVGVVIGTFTPSEPIVLSSYTNTTETALNYSAACTNCGARIGNGAGFRQSITITGTGMGTVTAGNRSTAANNIKVGTHQIADANITAWTPTSITFLTDSAVTGDTDANWGTVFGGASALTITLNSSTSNGLNFYLFPQVTSITVPTATANAAREYSASDSDGVITLNGTRFGTAATGGWVRILGCDSTTCSSPTGSAVTNSWSNTAIAVQVPAVIADNIYTGSVIMQQGTGSNNKSHTYTTTGFRILPRLTSLNPTSGIVGAAITVNGNHLCQNNAVCPSAFDTNNRVTFTSAINSTVFTSWSNTAIVTAVPTSALDGAVYVMSNAYQSNNSSSFSVLTPAPNDSTNLKQLKDAALTLPISVGSVSSSTNIYLTMTMLTDFAGGTLYPQIEYKPVGTAFTCSGTGACASATEGVGKAGPGPIDCSVLANGCAITITPTDGVYHWQARTRHFYGGTSYYSNWVSFGGNGENATDFQIDKNGPVITFSGANACADAVSSLLTNSANISWSLNESATGQIEYSKNSNLSASTIYPLTPNPTAFSHNLLLNNLDSNTTYYFQVKSVDSSGNTTLRPTNSPYCSFMTGNVTQPAKTTKFYVGSVEGTITGGSAASSDFSIYVPEDSVSVKNAFIELTGFSPSSGTNNVAVSVNNQATSTYSIASNGNSFKVLYPVSGANLNFDPIGNTFSIQPSLDTNITSAELVFTYSFAP